jgi:hypothetical protein
MENDNITVDGHLEQTMDNQKSVLTTMFNETFEKHEVTLDIIVDGLEHSNRNNFSIVSSIYNISGFINIVSYDLKIISRDLALSTKDWQKKLYARQAYLTIYESMDDLLEMCGKKLREEIKLLNDSDDLLKQLNIVIGKLNTFKSKYQTLLSDIRHNAIGHREKDMLKQLNHIKSINWVDSINLVSEYDSIIPELSSLCLVLMNRSIDEVHRQYGKA